MDAGKILSIVDKDINLLKKLRNVYVEDINTIPPHLTLYRDTIVGMLKEDINIIDKLILENQ
jgi:hypothetical protein